MSYPQTQRGVCEFVPDLECLNGWAPALGNGTASMVRDTFDVRVGGLVVFGVCFSLRQWIWRLLGSDECHRRLFGYVDPRCHGVFELLIGVWYICQSLSAIAP